MSELQRKTLIAATAASLTVPYALVWLQSTDAAENLAISMKVAYAIVAGIIVYVSLRLASVLFSDKILRVLNLAYVVIDLAVVGFVVIITGGQHSVFFNLWWATVVSATIFFGIAGTVCSSLAVAFIYPLAAIIARRLFGSFFSLSAALYSVYPFTLVSLMLGFLVQEERRQRKAREAAERSLQQAEKERQELQSRLDKISLTKREIEVLALVKEGFDNDQIATSLFVTKSAVKKHVSNILVKFDVDNRTQAAVLAERREFARAKLEPADSREPPVVKVNGDHRTTLFNFFFIYRWVMLLLALFMILNQTYVKVNSAVVLTAWVVVLAYTAITHYFRKTVVTLLERRPHLIAVDVFFGAALLAIGGGWQNVFFAYAMAPIFASVVLYGLAGGLAAAAADSLGMIVSMWLVGDTFAEIMLQGDLNPFIATVGGFYLVGYFSTLPAKLIGQTADRQILNQLFLEKLSEPKREIVMLVSEGKTDAEIAQLIHRSESTVKKHIRDILRQFELKNRVQIATLISQNAINPANTTPPDKK